MLPFEDTLFFLFGILASFLTLFFLLLLSFPPFLFISSFQIRRSKFDKLWKAVKIESNQIFTALIYLFLVSYTIKYFLSVSKVASVCVCV